MITQFKKLSYLQLLFVSAAISIVFSVLELLPNTPVNPDGLLYIQTANAYLQGGFSAANATFSWPFFPILCGYLSHLTKIPTYISIYAINVLFQALLTVSFIKLVRALGANENVQRWAAVVILIFPSLNAIRFYVIRDFGYWAFAVLAVAFFIEWLHKDKPRYAFYWAISMLIASLFRIEGLLIMIAMPFALWAQSQKTFLERTKNFILANIIPIVGLIAALCWHFSHHAQTSSTRLQEYNNQLFHFIPSLLIWLHRDAAKISLAILNENSNENGLTMLIGGIIAIYISSILVVFKPLYFLLACYGQYKKFISNKNGQVVVLNWIIIVNAIFLAVFTSENYFLSARYPMFMALIWMTFIPFSLHALHQAWKNQTLKFRALWPIILLILAAMTLGGLIRFGYSKAYIIDSARWLYRHSSAQDKVFAGTPQIAFYASNHYIDTERLKNLATGTAEQAIETATQYRFIALRINREEPITPTVQHYLDTHQPVKVFSNKRNDRVLIYQGNN